MSLIKTSKELLLLTAIFREEERKNIRKATKKMQADNAEKTTLGDLDALMNLKQKMDKE